MFPCHPELVSGSKLNFHRLIPDQARNDKRGKLGGFDKSLSSNTILEFFMGE